MRPPDPVPSERVMRAFLELVNRIRAWRVWYALRTATVVRHRAGRSVVPSTRIILRAITPHGGRVYSLCAECGVHLSASATLCDACARRRTTRRH